MPSLPGTTVGLPTVALPLPVSSVSPSPPASSSPTTPTQATTALAPTPEASATTQTGPLLDPVWVVVSFALILALAVGSVFVLRGRRRRRFVAEAIGSRPVGVPLLPARLIADYDRAIDDEGRTWALSALAAAGVSPIEPGAGDPIDPRIHHVVDVEPGGIAPGGAAVVARAIRPGWRSADEVLRPADVSAVAG